MVPHPALVPPLLATSDRIATPHRRSAVRACRHHPLRAVELPLRLEPVHQRLSWHRRAQHDPGGRWLRQLLLEIAAAL